MSELPATAVAYFETVEFTEHTAPDPLLHCHATRAGVWARVHVKQGRLRYRTLDGAQASAVVTPGHDAVIEPIVPHRLEIESPVRFRIELLRDEAVLPPLEAVLGARATVHAPA